jgi:hypothetical protein
MRRKRSFSVDRKERDLEADGRIILGLILEKWDGVIWTELIWLRIRTNGRLL